MAILASGNCGANGANVTWQVTDNYTLVISGSGDMEEGYYSTSHQPWNSYRTRITDIIINYGVTSIGTYAFCSSSLLTNVTIANSVTKINKDAFASCGSLTNIYIPESVTTVDKFAFHNSTALTHVEFLGNAPSTVYALSSGTPSFNSNVTIYYNEGTTGWTLDADGKWKGYTAVEVIIASNPIITESKHYKNIASAIRSKNGSTASYKPSEMASAIRSIVTGSTPATVIQATPTISICSSGLITASSTQSAGYVSGGTKTATKQLNTISGYTITPSASGRTAVTGGVYTTGDIYVEGDSSLSPENIRSGAIIFGVEGAYTGSAGSDSDSQEIKVYNLKESDIVISTASEEVRIYLPSDFNEIIAFSLSFGSSSPNHKCGTITLSYGDAKCSYIYAELNNVIDFGNFSISYETTSSRLDIYSDMFANNFNDEDLVSGFLVYR